MASGEYSSFASARRSLYESLSSSVYSGSSEPYDVDRDWCAPSDRPGLPNLPAACTLSATSLASFKEGVSSLPSLTELRDNFSISKLLARSASSSDNSIEPAASSLVCQLALHEALPDLDLPKVPSLPSLSHVRMATEMGSLLILPVGTSDLGTMSNESVSVAAEGLDFGGAEYPPPDDDNGNEASQHSPESASHVYNFIQQRVQSLIVASDPLLTRKQACICANYAVAVSAAYATPFPSEVSLQFLRRLFPPPLFTIYPARRKKHTVRSHIGCRKWSPNYFGLGVAVESRTKFVVCFTPNREEVTESNEEDFKIGDCVCTYVQGHAIDIAAAEEKSDVSIEGGSDGAFVDANNDSGVLHDNGQKIPAASSSWPSFPPELSILPSQGYVTIRMSPFVDDGNPNLTSNSDTDSDSDSDSDSENPASEEGSASEDGMKEDGGSINEPPSVPNPAHAAKGIAGELFAWGDNDCSCLGIPPPPQTSSSPEVIFTPRSVPLRALTTHNLSSAEHVR